LKVSSGINLILIFAVALLIRRTFNPYFQRR
jgi:hypothetical protein